MPMHDGKGAAAVLRRMQDVEGSYGFRLIGSGGGAPRNPRVLPSPAEGAGAHATELITRKPYHTNGGLH